jgi:NitT/TauT family transport system substrate-binding protein
MMKKLGVAIVVLCANLLFGVVLDAAAEVKEVSIAGQYGLPYLPFMVMEHEKLVEKHAKALRISELKVQWITLGGPAAGIDALLSGNLSYTGSGTTSLATLWDKTRGTPEEARAICAMQSMPYYLVTRNPKVKTIKDFTDTDKIALPSVKVTQQALVLEMAAAKEWGDANYAKLDPLTVSMAHPDAMAALLSGKGEVNSHLASSPFYYMELNRPGIHRVFKSYDVLGGPHTNGLIYTTTKFHDANPTVNRAVFLAFKEAAEFVYAKPKEAAAIYLKMTKDKRNSPETMEKWVLDPEVKYTQTPENTMEFVNFMHKVGRIKSRPSSWKDLFFPEAHGFKGS